MEETERIYRSSLRGLRKCPSCGLYVGNRTKGCSNKCCSLYLLKKTSKTKQSLDPVQLVSYRDTKIYSVQVKERDPGHRNFVQITDTTLSADKDGSIVSRNAICFVDTCKYDSRDISISCKHVKCASESYQYAQEITISKDVLYGMKIITELKSALWDLYTKSENIVPPIQRINKSVFAVECSQTITFPAGRLHLNVTPDEENVFNYTCACKKLKILLSSNDSVEIENDVCDHLLFLLAGVLSSPQLQDQFQNLMNALCCYWVKNDFSFESEFLTNEDFASFSENILNSVVEYNPENSLTETNLLHNDPSMTSEDIASKGTSEIITMPLPKEEISNQYTECLELADCQIELMDQFKLTNQIDMCNDEIQLCEDELFENNTIPCNINDVSEELFVSKSTETSNIPTNNEPKPKKRKKYEKPKITPVLHVEDTCLSPPTMEFNAWLTFVIEVINSSIEFDSAKTEIKHTFNIKNDFFIYLSEKFSIGEKRRIPNSTTIVKKGKHKGMMKSTWIFTTSSSIKRIFCCNELSIEIEKRFVEKSPGNFVPYTCDIFPESKRKYNEKERKILPMMYTAFINLVSKEPDQRRGFVIEWIPNAFPASKFGVLTIEFLIGFKKNNKIIDLLPNI